MDLDRLAFWLFTEPEVFTKEKVPCAKVNKKENSFTDHEYCRDYNGEIRSYAERGKLENKLFKGKTHTLLIDKPENWKKNEFGNNESNIHLKRKIKNLTTDSNDSLDLSAHCQKVSAKASDWQSQVAVVKEGSVKAEPEDIIESTSIINQLELLEEKDSWNRGNTEQPKLVEIKSSSASVLPKPVQITSNSTLVSPKPVQVASSLTNLFNPVKNQSYPATVLPKPAEIFSKYATGLPKPVPIASNSGTILPTPAQIFSRSATGLSKPVPIASNSGTILPTPAQIISSSATVMLKPVPVASNSGTILPKQIISTSTRVLPKPVPIASNSGKNLPNPAQILSNSATGLPKPVPIAFNSALILPKPVQNISNSAADTPKQIQVTSCSATVLPQPVQIVSNSAAILPQPVQIVSTSAAVLPQPVQIMSTSAVLPKTVPHVSPNTIRQQGNESATMPKNTNVVPHYILLDDGKLLQIGMAVAEVEKIATTAKQLEGKENAKQSMNGKENSEQTFVTIKQNDIPTTARHTGVLRKELQKKDFFIGDVSNIITRLPVNSKNKSVINASQKVKQKYSFSTSYKIQAKINPFTGKKYQKIRPKLNADGVSIPSDYDSDEMEIDEKNEEFKPKTFIFPNTSQICYVCGKFIEKRHNMYAHLKTHADRQFKCDTCGKLFSRNAHLLEHLHIHTESRPYVCELCGKAMRHESTFFRHMKIHKDDKRFECDICKKRFVEKHSMTVHRAKHAKKMKCKTCGKKFKDLEQFKEHKHEPKPVTCKDCGEMFPNKEEVTKHKAVHLEMLPYGCGSCGKSFSKPSHLEYHMNHHAESRKKINLRCITCNLLFFDNKSYEYHNKQHEKAPIVCEDCGETFIDLLALERHIPEHNRKDLSFGCGFCDKGFSKAMHLKFHMKKHDVIE